MMCDNWILISKGNKSIIDKNKIYNTYKNKNEIPPKPPKSLKPVCFEAFQTI